ncbi:hypothetical protein Taro_010231 [Colocasia esculenta]|uniref:Uncharacterized protein n=1 Tax=Colocasia esculenta TaxID=4460 RepID=A0A843UCD5_COLES|nr:hypothetical protein [Colocasia esculenta]
MPWSATSVGSRIRSCLRDYDRIQSVAVFLIYVQIGCSLVGSLGALYNGVLLINLVVALFALVAIENNSQSLGRTYAALLACGILLDIMNISSEKYGPLFLFSLRLVLCMQIIGFSVRSLSSLLWIQMYRLGVSWVDNAAYRASDFDVRNSFLNPPVHEPARQNSNSDDILGGSIYDPAYYSSLFEDTLDERYANKGGKQIICLNSASTSAAEPLLRSCISRSFQVTDVQDAPQSS